MLAMRAKRSRKASARHHRDLVKISCRISMKDYEDILVLVRNGTYSSVSEFVRHALEKLVYEYSRKTGKHMG